MKKFAVVALVMAVGVSIAFGATLKVPWFVDNAINNPGNPPPEDSTVGVVFLSNNTDDDIDATIRYFNLNGQELRTREWPNNTFVIPARASLAFRPYGDDDDADPLHMEEGAGKAVPNRSQTLLSGAAESPAKKNGSILINLTDPSVPASAVTGAYTYITRASAANGGSVYSYGHLILGTD